MAIRMMTRKTYALLQVYFRQKRMGRTGLNARLTLAQY
jgi:hypothetical protein